MTNRSFRLEQWASVDPADDWQFCTGRFGATGRDDLFGYHPSNGTLWVGDNKGGKFTFRQVGQVAPPGGWQFVAGNFGGGRQDVVGYSSSNGTVWLFRNDGHVFTALQWATVRPAADWKFAAGRFSGSGRTDLLGYHPSNGTLWLGRNTGAGFDFTKCGELSPMAGWQVHAADMTGNGLADVIAYHPSNGTIWVGENFCSGLQLRIWAQVDPPNGWQFAGGRFTNSAGADLVGYHPSNGTLWVGENTGASLRFWRWASVAPAAGWTVLSGSLDGDGWADVVGYFPGNGSIWSGRSVVRPLEGYCWPLSAAPGETLEFMLSAEGACSVTFSRCDSLSHAVNRTLMGVTNCVASVQAVPANAWRDGCGWRMTFQWQVPEHWPSGIYVAAVADQHGGTTEITFIVKPAADRRARIAVLANTNTWLAYNGWGSRSKYDGAAQVSYLRPNPVAAPEASTHLTRGELWILGWLAREGHQADVYTDIDFDGGLDAAQYRCLILSTHPEYWSLQMQDRLRSYLNSGGSLLYLGGNGLYEYGDYLPGRTGMIFRAGVENGPRAPGLFRYVGPNRAERTLLGVATERCGVQGSPYEVLAPAHPLLQGTGLIAGSLIGAAGLNTGYGNGQASAWEVDTASGPGALGIPAACATEDLPVPASVLPAGMTFLAKGRPDAEGLGADMITYDHPGGGIVFSVGSITFGGSLVVDQKLSRIINNALHRALG